VCASLAALLYGGPANPDRGFSGAPNPPDQAPALERVTAEQGFSLAAQEQKPALAEPDQAKSLDDARTALAEAPAQFDWDSIAASAGADVPSASSDRVQEIAVASREMSAVPPAPDTKPESSEPPAKVAAVDPSVKMTSVQTSAECLLLNDCVDRYLWSVYERTPKLDTVKTEDRVSVSVKKNGKLRSVLKTITKFMDENFAWKDPDAADKTGMPTMNYVIGGMDHDFKLRLYRLLRALDDAGLEPGITSAFRDDYRQSIAVGRKAASDNSYHGGSRHGGYGHGLAADLVSVRGETRADRQASSDELWKWIDVHGKEFGIGRPYLEKDPPHVGPIDGKEYTDHRGANGKHVASAANTKHVDSVMHGKHADTSANAKHADRPANTKLVDSAVHPKHADIPANAKRIESLTNAKRVDTPANAKRVDKN
jgi:hypothetical protein